MMTVDEIFAEDRRNPPAERSLPWEEARDGITVVIAVSYTHLTLPTICSV